MNYRDFEETSEEIDALEEEAEQQKETLQKREQRVQKIEQAVSQLSTDNRVIASVSESLQEAKREQAESEKEVQQKQAEIFDLESQLQSATEQLNEEYEVLKELMELGEDVSQAMEILTEKRDLIEACHTRLEQVAERLGITLNELCGEAFSDNIGTSNICEATYIEKTEKTVVQPVENDKQNNYDTEQILPLCNITPDMQTFSGFPICKGSGNYWYPAGGVGFAKFMEYEGADWSDYEIDRSGYENTIVMTPSRCIEGVCLFEGDVNSPERFWSQHQSGGTKESFVEIAAHIPDVKKRLLDGTSLEELYNDDVLGACANLYFSPNSGNAPTLLELDDGVYVFQSNGRHRILAARELGYSFPVKVTGRLRKK